MDAGGVLVGVGGRPDDDQRLGGRARGVAAHDHVDVVLGLEPGDHEVEAAGLEAEWLEHRGVAGFDQRRAVADQLGVDTELVFVVVGDALGIGDERVGPTHGERLGEPVVPPPAAAPLGPLPLEAVDMGGDRDAPGPQDRQQRGVRGVEHDGRVEPGAAWRGRPRARCGDSVSSGAGARPAGARDACRAYMSSSVSAPVRDERQ